MDGGASKKRTTKKKAPSPWNKFFAEFCKKNAGKYPQTKMMKAAAAAYKAKK